VLVLDPEVLDQPLELQLVRRVILDPAESAIRKVEIRISPIGHRPGANVIKLFESIIQGFLQKASVFRPGAYTIKLFMDIVYGLS
jgi:hypothetical protein